MQRHHDVICSSTKFTHPVLRGTLSDIAHKTCSLSRSGNECAKGFEREGWDFIFELQGYESIPSDTHVETIVRLATWDIPWIISGTRCKTYMPVLGSRNLRCVRLIAIDESPEHLAGFRWRYDGK